MAVNYHGKKFYNIDPLGQCYKNTAVILTLLFLGLKYHSNLQPFHCNLQGNIALWHRITALVWNAVNCQCKKFYNIDPCGQCYKTIVR